MTHELKVDNKVSVIIPFHRHENIEYLKACLASLVNQDIDLEIIIVINELPKSGLSFRELIYESFPDIDYHVHIDPTKQSYAEKMNFGASKATGTHILLAQDDLIFSENCIKIMAEEMGSLNMMMNPLSNCDNGCHFFTNIVSAIEGKEGFKLGRNHTLEELKDYIPGLMGRIAIAPAWQRVAYLCTYCTMMPMKVWQDIGGFDEGFRNGKEDIDLCLRANKKNVMMTINWNTFVLHFSGATSNHYDLKQDNINNDALFLKKWGKGLSEVIW